MSMSLIACTLPHHALTEKKKFSPTEVRTPAKGFKVLCANHYTIGLILYGSSFHLAYIHSTDEADMGKARLVSANNSSSQKINNSGTNAKHAKRECGIIGSRTFSKIELKSPAFLNYVA